MRSSEVSQPCVSPSSVLLYNLSFWYQCLYQSTFFQPQFPGIVVNSYFVYFLFPSPLGKILAGLIYQLLQFFFFFLILYANVLKCLEQIKYCCCCPLPYFNRHVNKVIIIIVVIILIIYYFITRGDIWVIGQV